MPPSPFRLGRTSQSLRREAVLFGLAAVYYFAAKLGLRFAYINSSVTTVWPPAGIALAAFVLLGYRVWPAILGAAFLANLTTTGAILPSIGIAIGNAGEGLLGAYLVNRFARGGRVFDRVRSPLSSVPPCLPRSASPRSRSAGSCRGWMRLGCGSPGGSVTRWATSS